MLVIVTKHNNKSILFNLLCVWIMDRWYKTDKILQGCVDTGWLDTDKTLQGYTDAGSGLGDWTQTKHYRATQTLALGKVTGHGQNTRGLHRHWPRGLGKVTGRWQNTTGLGDWTWDSERRAATYPTACSPSPSASWTAASSHPPASSAVRWRWQHRQCGCHWQRRFGSAIQCLLTGVWRG